MSTRQKAHRAAKFSQAANSESEAAGNRGQQEPAATTGDVNVLVDDITPEEEAIMLMALEEYERSVARAAEADREKS